MGPNVSFRNGKDRKNFKGSSWSWGEENHAEIQGSLRVLQYLSSWEGPQTYNNFNLKWRRTIWRPGPTLQDLKYYSKNGMDRNIFKGRSWSWGEENQEEIQGSLRVPQYHSNWEGPQTYSSFNLKQRRTIWKPGSDIIGLAEPYINRNWQGKKDQQKLPWKEEFDEFDNSSQEKQMEAEVNHKNNVYLYFPVLFCILLAHVLDHYWSPVSLVAICSNASINGANKEL